VIGSVRDEGFEGIDKQIRPNNFVFVLFLLLLLLILILIIIIIVSLLKCCTLFGALPSNTLFLESQQFMSIACLFLFSLYLNTFQPHLSIFYAVFLFFLLLLW
jgi:hypothetical protein